MGTDGAVTFEPAFLDDSELTPEAIGVAARIASWVARGERVTTAMVVERGPCGKDRVYRILNELTDAGYLEVRRVRGEDGKWRSQKFLFNVTR